MLLKGRMEDYEPVTGTTAFCTTLEFAYIKARYDGMQIICADMLPFPPSLRPPSIPPPRGISLALDRCAKSMIIFDGASKGP
jgi:hypothetical protein